MFLFATKEKSGSEDDGEYVKRFSGPQCTLQSGICVEDQFNEMLVRERKRAERSKKPFMLMLLNITNLPPSNNGHYAPDVVISTLTSSTRDIDLKGWYKFEHTLGVLFTEFGEADIEVAKEKILNNVNNALSANLTTEEFRTLSIACHIFPEDVDKSSSNYRSNLKLYPDILTGRRAKTISLSLKRMVDIAGSVVGLILCSPVFLVIAASVKLTSKGPVLFKQKRVGQFGKQFVFLKFRSMRVNNDPAIHKAYIKKLITEEAPDAKTSNGPVYKIKNDPRITRVGKFLRKTSLDELPQLLNVLKGDMSLVGPRPPIPYELECYQLWHRRRILEMKPGLTGLWQVHGRSRTTFDEMVRLDLRYTKEWSLWLDFRLILLTPYVALAGQGAY
jgi:lipopolysaccharide/colanic/teichoic acid biosynthesis glycosyltransferase